MMFNFFVITGVLAICVISVLRIIDFSLTKSQKAQTIETGCLYSFDEDSFFSEVQKAEDECSKPNSPLRDTEEFIDFPLKNRMEDNTLLENNIIRMFEGE